MPLHYDLIPEELRWTAQWCVAGPDAFGFPKVPNSITDRGLRKADPTNANSYTDFETVRDFADANPPHGLGFVLCATDPYVCIDLDIKNIHNEADQTKWTGQQDIDRFHRIVMSFHSYTERSTSGQGFHIWTKGYTGKGARRDGVEVYSQQRFITCTGDVVLDVPIAENQDLLDTLLTEMRRGEVPTLALVDSQQTEGDDVIIARAVRADNKDKFVALCNGDWSGLGYPSQSEADIALLTMLAFYSKSNAQVMRLFRTTGLGKRDKATKNDYYLTLSLKKVRSIAANEQASSEVGETIARALLARLAAQAPRLPPPPMPPIQAPSGAAGLPPTQPPSVPHSAPAATVPPHSRGNIAALGAVLPFVTQQQEPEYLEANEHAKFAPILHYPPGILGEIAQHIFNTAPRPVREVAIVAALGLLAGIAGRTFHIPQSGLNLYIVLVGQSAIGKEAMHSGISAIVKETASFAPSITSCVDFAEYVSAPALTKAVAMNPCFVNVSGEFGKKLQRMGSETRADATTQQLRTVMTNLYQKSGPAGIFGGLGYSDKEKNVASVSGVAYSMIGETTPGTFYDSLTDSMMEDGFLSRFTIIEYVGNRPAANKNLNQKLPPHLLEQLAGICSYSCDAGKRADSMLVTCSDEATLFLDTFDKQCDKEINSTQNEGWRQMWNRAHLKVYRIAALLAVADNYLFPIISLEQVLWANNLIMRDIGIMSRRMDSGDIGSSDASRENKLLALCKKYLTTPLAQGYAIPARMHVDGVIPRKFFQTATQRISCFANHRLGQTVSVDLAIRSLIDGGYLLETQKAEAIQNYKFHGKCYKILNIPMTSDEAKLAKSRGNIQ